MSEGHTQDALPGAPTSISVAQGRWNVRTVRRLIAAGKEQGLDPVVQMLEVRRR